MVWCGMGDGMVGGVVVMCGRIVFVVGVFSGDLEVWVVGGEFGGYVGVMMVGGGGGVGVVEVGLLGVMVGEVVCVDGSGGWVFVVVGVEVGVVEVGDGVVGVVVDCDDMIEFVIEDVGEGKVVRGVGVVVVVVRVGVGWGLGG